MSDQRVQLIVDMEEEQVLALIEHLLDQGEDPVGILEDCRAAMSIGVGEMEGCRPDLVKVWGDSMKEFGVYA